jgi:hypothetical protein
MINYTNINIKFGVLVVVIIKTAVLYSVVPCSLVDSIVSKKVPSER